MLPVVVVVVANTVRKNYIWIQMCVGTLQHILPATMHQIDFLINQTVQIEKLKQVLPPHQL